MPSAAAQTLGNFARVAQDEVHHFVRGVGIMMKEDEVLHSNFLSDIHTLKPGRMSPSFAIGGQLFGGKLGVVDENIGSGGELPQTLVELWIARFVVRGIHNGSDRSLNSKAETPLRVMQPPRCNSRAGKLELVATADFCKLAPCRHRSEIHGKIGIRHLRLKDALQAVSAQVLRTKTIEVQPVLFHV